MPLVLGQPELWYVASAVMGHEASSGGSQFIADLPSYVR